MILRVLSEKVLYIASPGGLEKVLYVASPGGLEKVLYVASPGGLEKVLYVASPGGLMCNKYGFRVTLWYIRGCIYIIVYTIYMYENIMPVRFKFKSYMYV